MEHKKALRILITNDDGIQAKGLSILEEVARKFTDDVWVVAPFEQQSGKGHSLTWGLPFRMREVGDKRFVVKGTPTDCMILALRKIMKDNPPDFVLSGINNGENIGESITMSGTIGAAMQATLQGVKAVALSQVSSEEKQQGNWEAAQQYCERVLKKIMTQQWPANSFFNINFPHVKKDSVKGIRMLRHGRRSLMGDMVESFDPHGNPYYWVGVLHKEENPPEDTDLWGVKNGYITVTPIQMDMTNYKTLKELETEINLEFNDS